LLAAADVSFGYNGGTVLSGVSFDAPRGAVSGILGPNGSGKTTLLRLLAGTLHPWSGHLTLDGLDLRTYSRRALARRLAVVPQETHLAFDYSVLEIALMGRYPHLGPFELEGPDDIAIARRALAATGTLALAPRRFSTLSGGEKQRVVIASALAQFDEHAKDGGRDTGTRGKGRPGADGVGASSATYEAQVLLLDEPTASLDLHYQVEVAALLRSLNAERGLTIVVSTHDLNFAAAVCRDLVLVREGTVVATGPTAAVLTPATVRALYGVDVDVRYHEQAGHLTVVALPR
jgi:iron complex transport system ATP-binding protein